MPPSAINYDVPLLRLDNVTVNGARGTALVAGISLCLGAGERLAVIGPNGCGKSSLLRALTGELPPSRGVISLAGRPLAAIGRAERAKKIALLAQNDPPDPRLRVEEYIALGRLPHYAGGMPGRDRHIVDDLIQETGMDNLRRRYLGSLSGGERQRAALARALAQMPELLLLDEPTNHLDPLARAQLMALVRNKGITVIAVLHDLPLVEPFADRVAVMSAGRLVKCDTPANALASECIRPVFGMVSFTVAHPISGLPLRIFDAPQNAPY